MDRGADGRPLRVIGVHTDISERKLAEETLRRSQSMLASTEAIAHVGSWEWNLATQGLAQLVQSLRFTEALARLAQTDRAESVRR